MFKIKNIVKNKNLVLFLKIALALFVLYLVISLFKTCKEGLTNNKKECILLHMNGCGHCDKLMPEWEKAKSENKSDVVMKEYESSTKKCKKLCETHDVKGFPTILMFNKDKGSEPTFYEGERSKKGILAALKLV